MKYEMMRFQFSHRIVKIPRGQRALYLNGTDMERRPVTLSTRLACLKL